MIKYITEKVLKHKILILIFVLTLSSSLLSVITPYYNSIFLDALTLGSSKDDVTNILLFLLILGIAATLLQIFLNYQIGKTRLKLRFEDHWKIISHVQRIPINESRKYNPAYLNDRISSDVSVIVDFMIDNYATAIFEAIKLILILYILFTIDFVVFIACLIFIPIYIFVYVNYRNKLYKTGLALKESNNIFNNFLYGQLANIINIKIENSFNRSNYHVKKNFNKLSSVFLGYLKTSTAFASIDSFISTIFHMLILVYGSYSIISNNITIGEFTVLLAYFVMVIQIVKYYLNMGKTYQDFKTSYNRINELLQIPAEENGFDKLTEIKKINIIHGEFHYPDKNIFTDINYSFNGGNCYIIQGKNGSGKSTLMELLIGLLSLNSGKITINDKNIVDIDIHDARECLISCFTQEPPFVNLKVNEFINMESIFEFDKKYLKVKNLYNISSDSMKELIIEKFNDNIFDLSSGEYQRIKLFNAVNKNFDVIILDEPTTYLDVETSTILINLINKFIELDKIVICISHDTDLPIKINNVNICKIEEL